VVAASNAFEIRFTVLMRRACCKREFSFTVIDAF